MILLRAVWQTTRAAALLDRALDRATLAEGFVPVTLRRAARRGRASGCGRPPRRSGRRRHSSRSSWPAPPSAACRSCRTWSRGGPWRRSAPAAPRDAGRQRAHRSERRRHHRQHRRRARRRRADRPHPPLPAADGARRAARVRAASPASGRRAHRRAGAVRRRRRHRAGGRRRLLRGRLAQQPHLPHRPAERTDDHDRRLRRGRVRRRPQAGGAGGAQRTERSGRGPQRRSLHRRHAQQPRPAGRAGHRDDPDDRRQRHARRSEPASATADRPWPRTSSNPVGVALAPNGDVYIADTGHNRIRRVAAATGIITTVAGDGLRRRGRRRRARGAGAPGGADGASPSCPPARRVTLYVADSLNGRMRVDRAGRHHLHARRSAALRDAVAALVSSFADGST